MEQYILQNRVTSYEHWNQKPQERFQYNKKYNYRPQYAPPGKPNKVQYAKGHVWERPKTAKGNRSMERDLLHDWGKLRQEKKNSKKTKKRRNKTEKKK